MAVQSKILTRTVKSLPGFKDGMQFASGTGTLALGIPGKIYDTFPGQGPGCHTTTLKADAEVGTFLAGQGIIVNAPEYALVSTTESLAGDPKNSALSPSLWLKAGTVVSCVTLGHVIVKESSVDAILAGMNGKVLDYPTDMYEDDSDSSEDSDADPLVVVEVTGLK